MQEPTFSSRLAMREYPKNTYRLFVQQWRELLFLHWEFTPEEIQKTLPKGLYVDTYLGKAYVGIAPFFIQSTSPVFLSNIPGLFSMLEINLRTYVYNSKGIPGVWFYSLNTNSMLTAVAARVIFKLPYYICKMDGKISENNQVTFNFKRGDKPNSNFIYKPIGSHFTADTDSLEFFLIERYALFFVDKNKEMRMRRVYHAPYSLNQVEVSLWDSQLFSLDQLPMPIGPPSHYIYSKGVDATIFASQ